MYALKTCPHCAARLSFFRVHFLQLMSYKCPRCGQTSNVAISQLTRMNRTFGIAGGVIVFLFTVAEVPWWWVFAWAPVLQILYGLVVVLFCSFEPVVQEVNAKD